jgi:hypothetical protein
LSKEACAAAPVRRPVASRAVSRRRDACDPRSELFCLSTRSADRLCEGVAAPYVISNAPALTDAIAPRTLRISEKGTPLEREGRKATGLRGYL